MVFVRIKRYLAKILMDQLEDIMSTVDYEEQIARLEERSSERLDRIEQKIDKLVDVIVQIARVEEKISDLEIRREEQHQRVNSLSKKIDSIDTHVTSLVEKVAAMQKVGWLVFGVFFAGVGSQLSQLF